MRKFAAILLLSGAALGGCATNDETAERAVTGAAIGAAAGAGVGAVVGGVSPVEGAVAGAVIGGAAGALTTPDNDASSTGYTSGQSYNNGTYTPTESTTTTRRAGERG
jgi:hypothetical protein